MDKNYWENRCKLAEDFILGHFDFAPSDDEFNDWIDFISKDIEYKYVCLNCDYIFEDDSLHQWDFIDQDNEVPVCPNCGEFNIGGNRCCGLFCNWDRDQQFNIIKANAMNIHKH